MTKSIEKKKGITGSTLKIIAMIIMLIDHIAAILLTGYLLKNGFEEALASGNAEMIQQFMAENGYIYYINLVMRMIGRIAFPIFAFLLIEGFMHTRNVKKYALNLGIFALISEIPFNLAFKGNIWDITYQNIFFTLFLALLVLIGFRMVEERFLEKRNLNIFLHAIIFGGGIAAGALLRTDYGGFGVATIAAMYLFRNKRILETAVGCVGLTLMSLSELPCFLSLIPIKLYNGKRGLSLKYAFYLFYPGHILLIYAIGKVMGII